LYLRTKSNVLLNLIELSLKNIFEEQQAKQNP